MTEGLLGTKIVRPQDAGWLALVVDTLRGGGLVAFPTDTVYGVAAGAFEGRAIQGIFAVKGRREDNPIPVLVAGISEIDRVASPLTGRVQLLAEAFWPGPLTIVVPKGPGVPEEIGWAGTVGLRAPDHPVAMSILSAAGPLAVSSANRSGEPALTSPSDVLASMAGRIDVLVDGGDAPGGLPSTVVDCTQDPPRILREGPVSLESILRIWSRGLTGS
jgi:L-threonylcarbamoyladenylate synthase